MSEDATRKLSGEARIVPGLLAGIAGLAVVLGLLGPQAAQAGLVLLAAGSAALAVWMRLALARDAPPPRAAPAPEASGIIRWLSGGVAGPSRVIAAMSKKIAVGTLSAGQREALAALGRAARRLERLGWDLDETVAQGRRARHPEAVQFSLRRLVEDTVLSLQPEADLRRLEITWELHADVPEAVRGDAERLARALEGLLAAVIGATDEGGVMLDVTRVGASRSSHRFELRVTGVGAGSVPEEALLFVRRHAEALGGLLRATPARPSFPPALAIEVDLVSEPAQPQALAAQDRRDRGRGERGLERPARAPRAEAARRIVVLEPSPVSALVLSRLVELAGAEAEVVASPAQVLGQDDVIRVVLLDTSHPEASAWADALGQLKPELRLIGLCAAGAEVPNVQAFATFVDRLAGAAGLRAALDRLLEPPAAERGPSPSRQAPPFDRSRLARNLGNDDKAAQVVLERFAEQAPSPGLREAQDDLPSLARAAHRLRGALLWISAERAASMAETLEALAQEGDISGAASALEALERELALIVAAIQGGSGPNSSPETEPDSSPTSWTPGSRSQRSAAPNRLAQDVLSDRE
jgi:hypothetical protein